jgi:hypothetical protein
LWEKLAASCEFKPICRLNPVYLVHECTGLSSESGPTFWKCPLPMGFTHYTISYTNVIMNLNIHRSRGIGGGRVLISVVVVFYFDFI